METNFPGSIDDSTSLPQPGPNSVTNVLSHAGLHDNEILAIQAIETKLGTGASTPTANKVLRATGTGTTAYAQVGLTTDVTGTLPVANGGTGIASLGSGVATFLGTPTSANLAAALTDETGSGSAVFGTSPAITTPTGIVKGDVGLGNVDNTSDTTKNSASVALTNKTITDSSNSIGGAALNGLYRQNTQADTTNTVQTGIIFKDGWGYFSAASGNTASKAVTFPTAFPNSIVNIEFALLGFKGTTAPTVITDFNTAINGEVLNLSATSISLSGLTINGYKTVAFSGTTNFYGFWWRALGT